MKPTVLIIEDEDNLLKLIQRMLQGQDLDLMVAHNGYEAEQIMNQRPPDLVITDMIMPIWSGIRTIQNIKFRLPDTKIIAFSGGGSIGPIVYLELALELGADKVMAKPIDRGDLLSAVQALI